MSVEARKVTETYSEEVVMKKWIDLFERLMVKGYGLKVNGYRLMVMG
jgi:hypothetical protein